MDFTCKPLSSAEISFNFGPETGSDLIAREMGKNGLPVSQEQGEIMGEKSFRFKLSVEKFAQLQAKHKSEGNFRFFGRDAFRGSQFFVNADVFFEIIGGSAIGGGQSSDLGAVGSNRKGDQGAHVRNSPLDAGGQLEAFVKEKMEKNPGINYRDAFIAVQKERPDLAARLLEQVRPTEEATRGSANF